MHRISDIIRSNKFYTVLIVFILAINLLALAGYLSEKQKASSEPQTQEETAALEDSKEGKLFDEEDIARRQEKFRELGQKNPVLYVFLGVFNLLILFVILLGVIFDVYFLVKWRKHEAISIRVVQPDAPRWSLSDVFKVILIFISFGYLFIIIQSFFAKVFPILNNDNFRMVFNTGVMNSVAISVILYFVIKKYTQKIKDLGLSLVKWPKSISSAVVGYMALVPILILIMMATLYVVKLLGYEPPVQPIVEVFMKEKETAVLLMSTLFAAIFGPIAEEIFFRGFMYPAVKKKFGIFGAVMVTSAIFAFLHAHLVGFLPIMALGILLAYLYEKTGSLVSSMVVHIVHNVGMVFLVFVMRYIGG